MYSFMIYDKILKIIYMHILSIGCTSLLFQLSYLLFEANDSVLTPSPYFPSFDPDFRYLGDGDYDNDDDDDDDALTTYR
jgi:hypothetical protein